MSTITFDTLQLVDKLKAAGFQQAQAEAIIRFLAEAQDTLVTKDYFDHKLEKELAPIRTGQAVQKWMMGVLLAGVLSLVLKVFF
ncbi:MAG: CCDC90 family protein [Methylococcaceae bacterium]|jgi:hypothetical protein|nr:CCDC90 family protein [Methylococcaceae bacterium]MDD1643929.1 CCDC90 family protein [Methylococcaceae bacterium]